jgi:hypothetical protein
MKKSETLIKTFTRARIQAIQVIPEASEKNECNTMNELHETHMKTRSMDIIEQAKQTRHFLNDNFNADEKKEILMNVVSNVDAYKSCTISSNPDEFSKYAIATKMEYAVCAQGTCPVCKGNTFKKYVSIFMPAVDVVCTNYTEKGISDHDEKGTRFFQIKMSFGDSPYFSKSSPGKIGYIQPGSRVWGEKCHAVSQNASIDEKSIVVGYICINALATDTDGKIDTVSVLNREKSFVLCPDLSKTGLNSDKYYTYSPNHFSSSHIKWDRNLVNQLELDHVFDTSITTIDASRLYNQSDPTTLILEELNAVYPESVVEIQNERARIAAKEKESYRQTLKEIYLSCEEIKKENDERSFYSPYDTRRREELWDEYKKTLTRTYIDDAVSSRTRASIAPKLTLNENGVEIATKAVNADAVEIPKNIEENTIILSKASIKKCETEIVNNVVNDVYTIIPSEFHDDTILEQIHTVDKALGTAIIQECYLKLENIKIMIDDKKNETIRTMWNDEFEKLDNQRRYSKRLHHFSSSQPPSKKKKNINKRAYLYLMNNYII